MKEFQEKISDLYNRLGDLLLGLQSTVDEIGEISSELCDLEFEMRSKLKEQKKEE